jgi:hypothetical protein
MAKVTPFEPLALLDCTAICPNLQTAVIGTTHFQKGLADYARLTTDLARMYQRRALYL